MKTIKKIFTWLFADFVYNLYEIIGQRVCKHIATTHIFALFRVNVANPGGIEIPNTRFDLGNPLFNLLTINPNLVYSATYEMNGHVTIDIASTDNIELRCTGASIQTALQGNLGSIVASLNIEKVGDPIIP